MLEVAAVEVLVARADCEALDPNALMVMPGPLNEPRWPSRA